MRKSAPTLADVARRAKVSTATVSRCLNSPAQLVPETRERVLAAVKQLGYLPNFGAKVLASKRSGMVGAIVPTMENAIFARGLQAFQEQMASAGMTLLVASSNYDQAREFTQIQTMIARGTDALLLIGAERPRETYELLQQRAVPYLLAWAFREGDGQCYAGFDNRRAARALAEVVIEHGHRDIAMIGGILEGNDRASDRARGVGEALQSAGLKPAKVVEARYTLEEGGRALNELMESPVPPSAVICGNDVLAAGAVIAAKKRGLRVPQDVSVTGFDDIDLALAVDPALTTVHVPHQSMGRAAADLLLAKLSGESEPASAIMETQIILRQSLGRIA